MGKGPKQNVKRRREKTVGAEKLRGKKSRSKASACGAMDRALVWLCGDRSWILQRGSPGMGTPLLVLVLSY